MTAELLTQLGLGGVLALMVIREVLRFLERRNGGSAAEMARKVDELHRWHDREDREGVKVWYTRPGLTDALADLGRAQAKLADSMDRMAETLARLHADLHG